MSESSTEKPVGEAQAEQQEDKKVPVAAVAKERAEKRAARAEADALHQELTKLKEQNPQLDMQQVVQALNEISEVRSQAAAQAAVKPLQEQMEKWKMAAQLGLSEAQADFVNSVRAKFPAATETQALLLARTEKPDLFPQATPSVQQTNRPLPGFAVTGDSPFRNVSDKPDFMSKIAEAEKAGDKKGAQHWAEQEFVRRITARRTGP